MYRTVDLTKGSTLTPEYGQINPQHTVPTLNDNGFILWDSHAICTYLIGKYASGKSALLYPSNDLQMRARIDQRLHFDSGILFPRFMAASFRVFFQRGTDFTPESLDAIRAAYELTESFLKNDPYMVGDRLTLADLACVTTITQMDMVIHPLDDNKYPKIRAWLNRLAAELPYLNELNTSILTELKMLGAIAIARNRERSSAAAKAKL